MNWKSKKSQNIRFWNFWLNMIFLDFSKYLFAANKMEKSTIIIIFSSLFLILSIFAIAYSTIVKNAISNANYTANCSNKDSVASLDYALSTVDIGLTISIIILILSIAALVYGFVDKFYWSKNAKASK
jgi:energy-coupling factor transporter transmembrane protein EcfT